MERPKYKTSTMRRALAVRSLRVTGRLWFDRLCGNTYNAARVYINGELVCVVPWGYGYGDHYITRARAALAEAGILNVPEDAGPLSLWCRENKVDCYLHAIDGRKADMIEWGTAPAGVPTAGAAA